MSSVQGREDAGGNWRAKYQALVAESEQREVQFRKKGSHYAALQRMLVGWVQDSDGTVNAALERMLEQLRQPGLGDSVAVQLEALELKMRELQSERNRRGAAMLAALSDMAAELKRAGKDPAQRKALAGLQRSLRAAAGGSAGGGALAGEELLLDALGKLRAAQQAFVEAMEAEPQASSAAGGWWQRWFGRAAAAVAHQSASADAAAAGVDALRTAEIDLSLHSDAVEGQRPDGLSDEVAAILLGLLARLEVPVAKRPVLQKLYVDLQNGLALDALVEVLDNTVEVVVAALSHDQSEFESFLSSLDDKLAFFDQFVRDLNRELGELVSGSEQLDSGVGAQLASIKSAFSDAREALSVAPDADSMQALQRRVFENLDAVATMLTEFSAGQIHYVAALEARLAELQAEVQELREESEQARQRIIDQRDKLLRDSLTGIANREAYEIRLSDEYKRWKRYQRPLSLVVADIDLFKQVNDSYGHAAGDRVLKIVAKLMSKQLRESDFIARYGGEEFVFLLPETDVPAATLAVEKVRAAIASSPFNFNKQPVPITCSFGIAEFAGEDQPEQVFERADKALYRAKDGGRNRFEVEQNQ